MVNSTVSSKTTSPSQSSPELTRGRRLGKYRLEKQLGTGGMCEVWKAKDCEEGIWVALKIPQADIRSQRKRPAAAMYRRADGYDR